MTESNRTVKAVRGKISLSDEITINVYKLPNDFYKLAGRNVTDAVKEDDKTLPRFYGVKSLKSLPGADESLPQIRADSGELFVPVSIPDAIRYWMAMGKAGNELADAVVFACATETIERRADREFNVTVSESVRDLRMASRILEFPCPGEPAFEPWFEELITKITGLHKNDIRTGRFYWEFVYCWLTPEERAHLEKINPPMSNGRRRYKIHDCLTPETKARLQPLQLKLAGKMESCKSVAELRRMVQRVSGYDQPNLFDGWDQEN